MGNIQILMGQMVAHRKLLHIVYHVSTTTTWGE